MNRSNNETDKEENLNIKELSDSLEKILDDKDIKKDSVKKEIKLDIGKYIALIKLLSTMRMMKEDNKPVEIIDNLFIGSVGAASNKQALLDHKITHIVVAASGVKNYFPEDFTYLTINLLDSVEQDIRQYFEESGRFIDNSIKNNGKVLVHCHAGISRSSTIILSYMIKFRDFNFEDALKLARSKRQKINPNTGFVEQLKKFELELKLEKY